MQLFGKSFALHLQSQMQYKLSFFLVTLGQFIVSFTAFLGVRFMFSRFNVVEGFAYEQVLLCYAIVLMAFSLAETFGSGFARFPGTLSNGEFDRVLVRPRGAVVQILLSKMDFTRLGMLAQAVLLFAYAIPQSGVVWTGDKIFTLCLMILCGSVVFFALFFVNAALAFFTTEGLEAMNIFTYGGRQFGRYPFSVYGKDLLRFLTYVVPLALFQYYPLLYLLGKDSNPLLMFAPLLSLLFVFPCYALFRLGLRRYKSTGS